jgi:hypothetical protein
MIAALLGLLLGACAGDRSRSFSVDGVTIDAQVIEGEGVTNLKLLISPKDGAKLASRPGVKLRPVEPDEVKWLVEMPLVRETEENGYFGAPQEFVVPFDREDSPRTIGLDVEYAYCQSDQLCIRTETTIEVPRG